MAVVVCGIDVGALGQPTWVAWLVDQHFTFDVYAPTLERPLPTPPAHIDPTVFALDAPQGLPAPGRRRRAADRAAKTPTSVLPATREELATWRLYRGPVVAGVEMFWSAYRLGAVRIGGLEDREDDRPLLVETYPRYVIKRLWPQLSIPSKRKAATDYVGSVWAEIAASGYTADSAALVHDQVDAALCALAAKASVGRGLRSSAVGEPPYADAGEQLLREGFIVGP